jgi:hypothetical protein
MGMGERGERNRDGWRGRERDKERKQGKKSKLHLS